MSFGENLALPSFAGTPPEAPRVLALEGPNGAGKTTLCKLLAKQLGAPSCLGIDESWFKEPFKTQMIRDAEWHASALFFLSGCCEQMRRLRSRSEYLVIMDRSLWSTLAVHAADTPSRLQTLLDLLRPIAPLVRVPDFTLVLEASFATCQSRIARKTGSARELDTLTATPGFHARESEFYRWLGRERSEVVFLDANPDGPECVAEQALHLVREIVPC